MASIDSISLATKFRGCLVGGLLGDCLGAPYEGHYGISKTAIERLDCRIWTRWPPAQQSSEPAHVRTKTSARTATLADVLHTPQRLTECALHTYMPLYRPNTKKNAILVDL